MLTGEFLGRKKIQDGMWNTRQKYNAELWSTYEMTMHLHIINSYVLYFVTIEFNNIMNGPVIYCMYFHHSSYWLHRPLQLFELINKSFPWAWFLTTRPLAILLYAFISLNILYFLHLILERGLYPSLFGYTRGCYLGQFSNTLCSLGLELFT